MLLYVTFLNKEKLDKLLQLDFKGITTFALHSDGIKSYYNLRIDSMTSQDVLSNLKILFNNISDKDYYRIEIY